MHDPRVGRFFATDPLEPEYPMLTPYQFSANTPIMAVELEGLESSNDPNPTQRKGRSTGDGSAKGTGKKDNRSLYEQLLDDPEGAMVSFFEGIASMIPDTNPSPQSTDDMVKTIERIFTTFTIYDDALRILDKEQDIADTPEIVINDQLGAAQNLYDNTTYSFGIWYSNISSGNLYQTSYAFGQGSFVLAEAATPGFGSETTFLTKNLLTTPDGFLFGRIKMRAPFDIKVQRFGYYSNKKFRLDFWGPRLFGTNTWAARTFNAILPDWNPLTRYNTGIIPKGTPMFFGITGPQGWNYPGGLFQYRVNSKTINSFKKIDTEILD